MPERCLRFSNAARFEPYSSILTYFHAYFILNALTVAAIVHLEILDKISTEFCYVCRADLESLCPFSLCIELN